MGWVVLQWRCGDLPGEVDRFRAILVVCQAPFGIHGTRRDHWICWYSFGQFRSVGGACPGRRLVQSALPMVQIWLTRFRMALPLHGHWSSRNRRDHGEELADPFPDRDRGQERKTESACLPALPATATLLPACLLPALAALGSAGAPEE